MADSDRLAPEVEFELRSTHERLEHLEAHVLRGLNLTVEQYRVLKAVEVSSAPGGSEIARRLMRSENSVSMLVDRMVKAKLLRRVRSEDDRREIIISLTNSAKIILHSASARHTELLRAITSRLEVSDIETLLSSLRTFQTAMSHSEQVL